MFYSKSKNTWFAPEFRDAYEATGSWPDDAAEYTRELYDLTVSFRPIDKVLSHDVDGHPILIDLPPPTDEELAAAERTWRDGELARADIGLNKVQDGMGSGTVTAWREYRCQLRTWPENPAFPDTELRPIAPDAA